MLHCFPALAIVQFHPIILSIFDVSCVLECLREQITKIVVIGRILKSEIPHVAQIFVELFCHCLRVRRIAQREGTNEVPG